MLLMLGDGIETFLGSSAKAANRVFDVLNGLGQGGDHGLVGAELGDGVEPLDCNLVCIPHALRAFLQNIGAARCQQHRALAG